jgi:hypothetical protein
MLNVRRELLAERGGVLGIQVDLIVGAVESEPDGLFGRAAGQVVFEDDTNFLGHLHLLAVQMVSSSYRGRCPITVSNALDQACAHGLHKSVHGAVICNALRVGHDPQDDTAMRVGSRRKHSGKLLLAQLFGGLHDDDQWLIGVGGATHNVLDLLALAPQRFG